MLPVSSGGGRPDHCFSESYFEWAGFPRSWNDLGDRERVLEVLGNLLQSYSETVSVPLHGTGAIPHHRERERERERERKREIYKERQKQRQKMR